MAEVIAILGESGDGKSTSTVINPDGKCHYLFKDHPNYSEEYKGINKDDTYYINCDGKPLPFPTEGWKVIKNTSKLSTIMGKGLEAFDDAGNFKTADLGLLGKAHDSKVVKRVIIDTINGIMNDREMLESKKLTFDRWMDLAKDIYELITVCNKLRPDLIIYLMGHVTLYTNTDGIESKCLVTNGRKLEKIKLETKLTTVLYTRCEAAGDGNSRFYFETQKNRSTGKSPLGLFKDFLIPNSLQLVDESMRKFRGFSN